MSGGQIIGLVTIIFLFGGPFLVGIVHAVMSNWAKVQAHREDTDLKHTLVNAGFSAEEIVRIVSAGGKRDQDEQEGEQSDEDIKPFQETEIKAG